MSHVFEKGRSYQNVSRGKSHLCAYETGLESCAGALFYGFFIFCCIDRLSSTIWQRYNQPNIECIRCFFCFLFCCAFLPHSPASDAVRCAMRNSVISSWHVLTVLFIFDKYAHEKLSAQYMTSCP